MNVKSLLFILGLLGAQSAWGSLLFSFSQQADGVHVDVSGTVNTSALTAGGTSAFSADTSLAPAEKAVYVVQGTTPTLTVYDLTYGTLQPFGKITSANGTWLSGTIGMDTSGYTDFLFLDPNYVSGSPLTASAIFPGTYATYGFPGGSIVDQLPGNQTITLYFSPEPSTWTTAAGALVLTLWAARRRRR